MDRKDYISDNLRNISDTLKDVSKYGAKLPVYNPDIDDCIAENESLDDKSNSVNELNRSQERRLSDVYNAKLDVVARMTKAIATLSELENDQQRQKELRKNIINELERKLAEFEKLNEPTDSKELLAYIRKVEHLRMEFFTYEAQVNKEMNSIITGSSISSSIDVKYFYKIAKSLVITLIVLTITIIVSALIVATAIWSSMKV